MLWFSARAGDRGDRSVRAGLEAERSDGRVQAATVQAPRHPCGEDGDRERRQSERRAGTGWLRQLSLIYSGLIIIGVYLVAPFLTAASLDLPAKVCVVAFSVAIPLLAAW
jgi:hypothetical protein